MADIDSIVAATLTTEQKEELACYHIRKAFDMPRKYEKVRSSDPAWFLVVIQAQIRGFLKKKHAMLAETILSHYKCPLSLNLYMNPVTASDGYTYDYDMIVQFFGGVTTFPARGPMGVTMANKTLVPNYNLRSEIADYRDLNKLPPCCSVEIGAEFKPASASTTVSRTATSYYQPSLSVDALRRLNLPLGQLLGHDAFLNEVRKPGLVKVLSTCLSLRPYARATPMEQNKSALIRDIVSIYPTNADPIIRMFDDETLLKTITGNGLDLILASLGRRVSGGGVAWKIKCILLHIPLTITVRDDIGTYDLTIDRTFSAEKLYSIVSYHRSCLKLENNETVHVGAMVGDYTFKNGTIIESVLRHQFRPQMAMASDAFQIFVKMVHQHPVTTEADVAAAIRSLGEDPDLATSGASITLVVKSDTTLLTVKEMIESRDNHPVDQQRLIFGGKQLQPYQSTLASHGVHNLCTLHLVLRLPGGMGKKGVKKVLKAERMAQLKASCLYKSSMVPRPVVDRVIQPLTSGGANSLAEELNKLTLEQLTACRDELNELPRSSDAGIAEVLAPYIVPDVRLVKNSISEMKQRIIEAEAQLEAVYSAVTVSFAEMYYKEAQYDYSSFYTAVDDRITHLEEETNRRAREAERAEFERQLAVAQRASTAAGSDAMAE